MIKNVLAFTFALLIAASAACASESTNQPSDQPANQPGFQPSDTLKVGMVAPNFTRTTSTGKKISLKQFRHKVPVILYFYPESGTPNCVKEACGFRDFYHKMEGKGAEIIGVSNDTSASQKTFIANYQLPFDIISDCDDSLLNLYRVPFFRGSHHKRVTFVIDKNGIITNVIQYTNDGDVHVKEATAALNLLKPER